MTTLSGLNPYLYRPHFGGPKNSREPRGYSRVNPPTPEDFRFNAALRWLYLGFVHDEDSRGQIGADCNRVFNMLASYNAVGDASLMPSQQPETVNGFRFEAIPFRPEMLTELRDKYNRRAAKTQTPVDRKKLEGIALTFDRLHQTYTGRDEEKKLDTTIYVRGLLSSAYEEGIVAAHLPWSKD